jgi:hypothetical protein
MLKNLVSPNKETRNSKKGWQAVGASLERLEERILLSADEILQPVEGAEVQDEIIQQEETVLLLDESELTKIQTVENISGIASNFDYQPATPLSDLFPSSNLAGTAGFSDAIELQAVFDRGFIIENIHLTGMDSVAAIDSLEINSNQMFSGSGTVDGDVVVHGLLSPGNSPGIQNYNDLTLTGVSVTQIEIGGVTAGPGSLVVDNGYDQINASGSVSLDGTLDIDLLNDFDPQVGQQFDILTYGAVSGSFADYSSLYIGEGLYFNPNFQPDRLTLEVAQLPIPGLELDIADASELDGLMSLLVEPTLLNQPVSATGSFQLAGQSINGTLTFNQTEAGVYEVTATDVSAQFSAGDGLLSFSNGSGAFYLTSSGMAGSVDGDVSLSGITGITLGDAPLSLSFNTLGEDVTLTLAGAGDHVLDLAANTGIGVRGTTEFTVDDLASFSGDFSIVAATEAGVGRLRIGGSNISASVGDIDNGLGISIAGGDLALLIVDGDSGPKYAVSASGDATLHGVDDGSLTGPLLLRLNTLGQTVDEVIDNGVKPLNLTFTDIALSPSFSASGVTLDLGGDIGSITGDLYIQATVAAESSELALGVENISASINLGGVGTAALESGRAALLLTRDTDGFQYAVTTSGNASLQGIEDVTLSGDDLTLIYNATDGAINRTIQTTNGTIDLIAEAGYSAINGIASLDIAGLLTAEGEIGLEMLADSVDLSDGTESVAVERLTLTGSGVTAALNAPDLPAVGVTLKDLDFGLVFLTEQGDWDPRRWVSMTALPEEIEMAGVTFSPTTATLTLNQALSRVSGAANDTVVDWSGQTQTFATDALSDVVMDFADETWILPVSGEMSLLGETVRGDFQLSMNPNDGIYEVTGTNLELSLDAGIAGISIIEGAGSFQFSPDGIAGTFTASASLTGLDGVSFSLPEVVLAFNNMETERLGIAAKTDLNLSALGAALEIGDFTQVSGNFSISRQVVDGVEQLMIGGRNISSSLGDVAGGYGISVDEADLALLISGTEQGSKYALMASGISTLNGFTDTAMSSAQPMAIRINTLGEAVQEQIYNGQDMVQLAFDTGVAEQTFLLENATLDMGGNLGSITGDLRFAASLNSQGDVQLTLDARNLTGSLALVGGVAVELSLGTGNLKFNKVGNALVTTGNFAGTADLTGLNGLAITDGSVDLNLDAGNILQSGSLTGAITLAGQSYSGSMYVERVGDGEYELSASNIETQLSAGSAVLSLTNGSGGIYLSESGIAGSIGGQVSLSGLPGMTLNETDLAVAFNTFDQTFEHTIASVGFHKLEIGANTPLRLAGDMAFTLDDLASFSGEVVVEASTVGGVDRLLIGGRGLTATVGDSASGVAVSLTDGQMALLVADDGSGAKMALDASGIAALHGVSDGEIAGQIKVRLNTLGQEVSESFTNGVETVALQFDDGAVVQAFDILGARLDLGESVGYIEGDLRIQGSVTDDQSEVRIGASNVNGHFGVGPAGVTLEDGVAGLLLSYSDADGYGYAVTAEGRASLEGIDALTLESDQLTIAINETGSALVQNIATPDSTLVLDLQVGESTINGLVAMDLAGLLAIEGEITISSLSDTITLSDSTSDLAADRLNIIGSDLTATLNAPG